MTLSAATAQPTSPVSNSVTLAEVFLSSAGMWPDRPCIAGDDVSWTYEETASRAAALAGRLAAAGVRHGDRVGLILERSARLPLSILALMLLGAAYVPLDPGYPDEWLRFVAADADVRIVIGARDTARRLGRDGVVVVDPAQPCEDTAPVQVRTAPDDPAYVIYTSGSTGRPKGCVITHRNAVALLRGALPLFAFGCEDRWSLFHSAAFDFSVWELWGALATGAAVVVVPSRCAQMPDEFLVFLRRHRITVLNQVPSVFRALSTAHAERGGPPLDLRYLVFGGESVDLDVVRGFLERLGNPPTVVNMYGITEITVHATFKRLTARDLAGPVRSPIGLPLPHLEIDVLDEDGRPVAEGETGEMWVSGDAVAAGYLNRPDLTAQRFLVRRTAGLERRVYRTGDLAMRLPGGELGYAGRNDQQVKLRGFRIELGEIETVLRAHPRVRDAAVTVVTTSAGSQFLTACVVRGDQPGDGNQNLTEVLRPYAREKLPSYMVPDRYTAVPWLPLTPSGKLDRAALESLARTWSRTKQAR